MDLKSFQAVILRKLHPVEIIGYSTLIISFPIALLFSLRFYLPDINTAVFIWNHYFGPLVPALILSLTILVITHYKTGKMRALSNSLIIHLRIFVAFTVTVYLHFNMKLWAQLINGKRFDAQYLMIDQYFSSLIATVVTIRKILNSFFPVHFNNIYHDLFVAMFILSFLLHAFLRRGFEQIITATALVLSLGGIAYSLAPALGPFIYEQGACSTATGIQQHMLTFYHNFVESKGAAYNSAYFVSAVAAMPSLHIANAAVFTYFSLKDIPWLSIVYIPVFLYLTAEAIALKWHYVIDIPAGLLIALIAIRITFSFDKNATVSISNNDFRKD